MSWIGARAATVATLFLLAHAVGPDGVGTILAAIAMGQLGAALATDGLSNATARNAAASDESVFGLGDIMTAIRRFCYVLPVTIVAAYFLQPQGSAGLILVGATVALTVTQGLAMIFSSVFRARGEAGMFAIVNILASAVGRLVIAAVALLIGMSAAAVLGAFVILNGAVIWFTWTRAIRGLPKTNSGFSGYGPIQLGGAVWSLLGNLDVVVVGLLVGIGTAGTFGTAMRFAEFSCQFVTAVAVLYLPEATRLAISHKTDALINLYRVTAKWSALTTVLIAGTVFILAPQLGALTFPDQASEVALLLRILLVGYLAQGALGSNYATLVAIGAFKSILLMSSISLPLVIAVTVSSTAVWGAVGAAVATSALYLSLNIWWTQRVAIEIGATPFDPRYLRTISACVCSLLAGAAVAGALSTAGSVVVILVTVAVITVSIMLTARVFNVLSPAEYEVIQARALSSLRGGA